MMYNVFVLLDNAYAFMHKNQVIPWDTSLARRNRICNFSAAFRTQKKHIFIVILIVIHILLILTKQGSLVGLIRPSSLAGPTGPAKDH